MNNIVRLKEVFIFFTIVVLATHFLALSRSLNIMDTNTMYAFYSILLVVYFYFLYDINRKRMYYKVFATTPFVSYQYHVIDHALSYGHSEPAVTSFNARNENILTQKHFILWMQANTMPFGLAIYIQIDNYSELQKAYGNTFTTLMMTHYNKKGYDLFDKNCVFGRVSEDTYLFVLMAPVINQEIKDSFIKTIRDTFSKPMKYDSTTIHIKKTLGIAVTNRNIDEDYILINEAKLALETAHRNHVSEAEFDSRLKQKILHQTKIMNRLNQAIIDDQIQMVYQKIIDTTDHEVHSVEILSRWFDVELGNINPESMLDIARESNLIKDLDYHLIDKALELYQTLSDAYPKALLSLNITPETFTDPANPKTLLNMLKKHKIQAKHVCIEVSESMFALDIKQCINAVKKHHELGFLIAIDDFGKAFSSLGILNKIPYDYLKIDRSLINDIDSSKTLEIIKALKKVTELSDTKMIIEGVETSEQYNALLDHNCTLLQGFYLHKPEKND